jgi:putative ABC transport system ATP-binding protein
MEQPVLAFRNVSRDYPIEGGPTLKVLRGITAEVRKRRAVSVTGQSGSGKSTLLHLAAGIDEPSAGQVLLLGRDLSAMSDGERALARREGIGIVVQFFHLLAHLSAIDNVLLPALIAGGGMAARRERALALLSRVGLLDRAGEAVQKLSGGEMQRVAICRALLLRPQLLLADEPTGNLDEDAGLRVMELLLAMVREEGSTLLYVTHSRELAALADETWRLHNGLLERGPG